MNQIIRELFPPFLHYLFLDIFKVEVGNIHNHVIIRRRDSNFIKLDVATYEGRSMMPTDMFSNRKEVVLFILVQFFNLHVLDMYLLLNFSCKLLILLFPILLLFQLFLLFFLNLFLTCFHYVTIIIACIYCAVLMFIINCCPYFLLCLLITVS